MILEMKADDLDFTKNTFAYLWRVYDVDKRRHRFIKIQ